MPFKPCSSIPPKTRPKSIFDQKHDQNAIFDQKHDQNAIYDQKHDQNAIYDQEKLVREDLVVLLVVFQKRPKTRTKVRPKVLEYVLPLSHGNCPVLNKIFQKLKETD